MEHSNEYGYGYWSIVIGSALFMSMIIFSVFKPKTKNDWKSMGALSAFFVALFTEMYGFPFTIYLLTSWLGKKYPVIDPFSHDNGHILKVLFKDNRLLAFMVHPGSNILMIAAILIIAIGWKQIHQGQGNLVKEGIYRYIRHPQYTGFYLIIFAFLLQWPTVITLAMAPFLLWLYNHLAKKEEHYMINEFGNDYIQYMEQTHRFFPSFQQWRAIARKR